MDFGFIITRHVKDKTTNEYWNRCIKTIKKFYPRKKIIVIDDNSKQQYVRADEPYENVHIFNSIFPGRGELLPYLYLSKHAFFPRAIILHDSVFFQKRINFESLSQFQVLPLWHFEYRENIQKCIEISQKLNNAHFVIEKMNYNPVEQFGFKPGDKWYGCFGVQCYIDLDFLQMINRKYKLSNLIEVVQTRKERCCLERIMGAIFYKESPKLYKTPSLLGNIWKYQNWGYSHAEHEKENKYPQHAIVKVWTGR
jgi:hypothetical protein